MGIGSTAPWKLFLVLAAVVGPPACRPAPGPPSQDTLSPIKLRLRVGVSETSPPVIFEKGGKVVGIEADLAHRLGDAIGREVEFVSMFWPNLLFELQGGRIDIVMSGISVTERRKLRVAFSQPYMHIGQQAMVRRVDLATLGTTEAVRATNRRVGAEVGTTAMRFIRENLRGASKAKFSTVAKAMEALDQGEIDVVVHDSPAIQWHAERDFDGRLVAVPGLMTREPIAWAVNRENHQMLKQVNEVLASWRRDGTLAGIVGKWLPKHD